MSLLHVDLAVVLHEFLEQKTPLNASTAVYVHALQTWLPESTSKSMKVGKIAVIKSKVKSL